MPIGRGSTSMFAAGTSGMAACSASAMSALVSTSTRSGGTRGASRATASAISGRSPTSASSALGRSGVLSGQNRDPMPPANTRAHMPSAASLTPSGSGCSAGAASSASSVSAPVPPTANAASIGSPNGSATSPGEAPKDDGAAGCGDAGDVAGDGDGAADGRWRAGSVMSGGRRARHN